MPTSKTHRHFLVAPLFALALTASVLPVIAGNGTHALASIVEDAAIPTEDDRVSLPGGRALLLDGAQVDQKDAPLHLDAGSILVSASDSLVTVTAGPWRVSAMCGAFSLTAGTNVVTVAALSAPVLVSGQGGRAVVLAGQQLRLASDSLPALADGWSQWQDARAPMMLPDGFRLAMERLLDDRLRTEKRCTEQTVSDLLSGSAGKMPSDEEDTLLALHPQFHALAWTFPLPQGRLDTRVLRLLLLPLTDLEAEALSSVSREKWKAEAALFLSQSPAAVDFLDLLARSIEDVVRRTEALGYVERQQFYSRAFADLAEPFGLEFSKQSRSIVEQSKKQQIFPQSAFATPEPLFARAGTRGDTRRYDTDVHPDKPTQADVQPLDPVTAKKLEMQTRQLLDDAGFLFTVKAAITAQTQESVFVSGVVFSTETADHTYAFVYNPVRHAVSSIERDGEPVPFPMGWEGFGEWVEK